MIVRDKKLARAISSLACRRHDEFLIRIPDIFLAFSLWRETTRTDATRYIRLIVFSHQPSRSRRTVNPVFVMRHTFFSTFWFYRRKCRNPVGRSLPRNDRIFIALMMYTERFLELYDRGDYYRNRKKSASDIFPREWIWKYP